MLTDGQTKKKKTTTKLQSNHVDLFSKKMLMLAESIMVFSIFMSSLKQNKKKKIQHF